MALFQCVIAVLVAAGVAVQPEAPVRRHREAAQTTEPTYVKGPNNGTVADPNDGICPAGNVHVKTLDECRSAYNEFYKADSSVRWEANYRHFANQPTGCWFNIPQNKVVWNTHPTGCPCAKECAGNGVSICKPKTTSTSSYTKLGNGWCNTKAGNTRIIMTGAKNNRESVADLRARGGRTYTEDEAKAACDDTPCCVAFTLHKDQGKRIGLYKGDNKCATRTGWTQVESWSKAR